MAVLSTIIAAAGLAVAAGGAYMQYKGQKEQANLQKEIIAQNQQSEALRQRQLNLDANRRKREMIRAALGARAAALAQTTAQGAAGAGGSALPGAYGSISGRTGVNQLGVNQNQEIGNAQFGINRTIGSLQMRSADAGSQASLGAGLSSLGGALMRNSDVIGKVGSYVSGYFGSSGGANSLGGRLASRYA